jgi:NDP-sugar pyrophosphorylase family protein
VPKPLLLVANRPILRNTVEGLRDSGITDLLFVVQHQKDKIISHFEDGEDYGVNIRYVEQPAMKGTGEAARLARGFADGDDIMLVFGDILTPSRNILGILQTFRRHSPFVVLAVRHVDDPSEGAAVYVEDGIVERIVEKPPAGTSATNLNNAGIFAFSNGIFEILEQLKLSPRGEYELTDAIQICIQRKSQVRAYEIEGYWSNISSPEDLIATNALVLEGYRKPYLLDPSVRIGEACKIGQNVCVAADSLIGSHVKISNSVVGRGVVIGDECTLDHVYARENTRVEPGTSVMGTAKRVTVL